MGKRYFLGLAVILGALLILTNACALVSLSSSAVRPTIQTQNLATAQPIAQPSIQPSVQPTFQPFIQPSLGAVRGCFPSPDLHPTRDGLGDPYFPQLGNGGYDALHYTLDVQVDLDQNVIQGVTRIDAQATQNLNSFSLDLLGLNIQKIEVQGQPAQYRRSDLDLVITPAVPIKSGEKFLISVTYAGTPKPVDSGVGITLGWLPFSGGIYVASEPNGASAWYPVNDHPCDKATYSFRITVPKPYTAVANGLLKQVVDNGSTRTFILEEDRPMASYLVTVDIAQFTEQDAKSPEGIPVRNYFSEGLQDQVSSYFSRTPQMLSFFSSIYGPYPFEAYGVVVVNSDLGFALETQTLSLFGPSRMDSREQADAVAAHELAHQWFGDSVSLKTWKDIWLNEGFATYSQWLWLEHTDGRSALDDQIRTWYQRMQSPGQPPPGDPSPNDLFAGSVYYRGGLTLHALRLKVGDPTFFRIMRTYADRYRYGNADTQDFISLAEEVSGQNLKDFFQAWLYQNSLPPIPEMDLKPGA
jgi:aminopeptidase N